MTKTILLSISLFIASVSCHSQERNTRFKGFDNSLDSLITEPVYSACPIMTLDGDTLHGNPVEVRESGFLFHGKDTIPLNRTNRICKFKDNLMTEETISIDKEPFTGIFVFFDEEIDDNRLNYLRNVTYTEPNTVVIGAVLKFDKKGNLIKALHAYADDNRFVAIRKFDDQNRETEVWSKNYQHKIFLHKVTTYVEGYGRPAHKLYENGVLKEDVEALPAELMEKKITPVYTFDKHGNWIRKEERRSDHYAKVWFRTILYE